jgi:signal peptidase II
MSLSTRPARSSSVRLFWPLTIVVVLVDCTTKRVVEAAAPVVGVPHRIIDDILRVTLEYNRGGAMSTYLGPYQRWILVGLTMTVLALLARNYSRAARAGRVAVVGLALVAGGAIGNLLDRLTSPRGVVDFLDVGIGTSRFYVFNLADVGVCVGAALLAFALWRADGRVRE